MKAIRRKQVNGWAAALLLPILLRVLVPVGFMPVVGPDFSLQLVVCAGDGPMLASHALPMSASMDMDMSAGMPMDEPASSGGLDAHLHHDDRGACPYGSRRRLAPSRRSLFKYPVLFN